MGEEVDFAFLDGTRGGHRVWPSKIEEGGNEFLGSKEGKYCDDSCYKYQENFSRTEHEKVRMYQDYISTYICLHGRVRRRWVIRWWPSRTSAISEDFSEGSESSIDHLQLGPVQAVLYTESKYTWIGNASMLQTKIILVGAAECWMIDVQC